MGFESLDMVTSNKWEQLRSQETNEVRPSAALSAAVTESAGHETGGGTHVEPRGCRELKG